MKIDELSCWTGYHRVKGTVAGTKGSCAKNESTTTEDSIISNVTDKIKSVFQPQNTQSGSKDTSSLQKSRDALQSGTAQNVGQDSTLGNMNTRNKAIKDTEADIAKNEGKKAPPKEADYGPEYQAMVKRVGQKAKQQELAKKKQEQPKSLDESTIELNKILKLSGYNK